MNKRVELKNKI